MRHLLLCLCGGLLAAAVTADQQGEARNDGAALRLPAAQTQWWRDARVGLFLHWGLYAIPDEKKKTEWTLFMDRWDLRDYVALAQSFTAERYDPAAWAQLAVDAGCRYTVLTTRHHDGFALWDSPSSHQGFDSVRSAAKRDLVRGYVDAVRAAGLRVGLYYSPLDWRFPGYFFPEMYRENAEALRDQTYAQVRELMSGYGAIDILWYDGGGDEWLGHGGLLFVPGKNGWQRRPREQRYTGKPLYEPEKLNALVRQLQPGVMVGDRSGVRMDFRSRETEDGGFDVSQPWERCVKIVLP